VSDAERIVELLLATSGAMCEDCLAGKLGRSVAEVNDATRMLSQYIRIVSAPGPCAVCRQVGRFIGIGSIRGEPLHGTGAWGGARRWGVRSSGSSGKHLRRARSAAGPAAQP
jgi:hypothetical protein